MQNHNANIQLQQSIEEIFKELNLQHSNRVLLKKQDCGILREDYGVIENGQKVGGITCFKADPLFDTPKVLDDKFLDETCIIKGCEYKKVWVKFGTTLQMKPNSIDYYVVNVGYVFPDGYVTTQIDHDAVEKHEKGHVADFQCIANKFSNESKYIEIEVEDGVIKEVFYWGGCNGNLQGISRLVKGMKVDDVIAKLEGVRCGNRATSCPDQLCKALREMQA